MAFYQGFKHNAYMNIPKIEEIISETTDPERGLQSSLFWVEALSRDGWKRLEGKNRELGFRRRRDAKRTACRVREQFLHETRVVVLENDTKIRSSRCEKGKVKALTPDQAKQIVFEMAEEKTVGVDRMPRRLHWTEIHFPTGEKWRFEGDDLQYGFSKLSDAKAFAKLIEQKLGLPVSVISEPNQGDMATAWSRVLEDSLVLECEWSAGLCEKTQKNGTRFCKKHQDDGKAEKRSYA